MSESLPPRYFENIYSASKDPWSFETSPYEKDKYADTLRTLPRDHYDHALEIGCSIGVFTEMLAARCGDLVAIDVSDKAILTARRRCSYLSHVSFDKMQVPQEYPAAIFDLTVVAEVGYYWNRVDLGKAASLIVSHLKEDGHLLLVHWTPTVPDYPLTGDEVHEFFLSYPGLSRLSGHASERYRIDVLQKAGSVSNEKCEAESALR